MRNGERLATDKRQSSVNGAEMCSLYAAPVSSNGEGEDAEGGILPDLHPVSGVCFEIQEDTSSQSDRPCRTTGRVKAYRWISIGYVE